MVIKFTWFRLFKISVILYNTKSDRLWDYTYDKKKNISTHLSYRHISMEMPSNSPILTAWYNPLFYGLKAKYIHISNTFLQLEWIEKNEIFLSLAKYKNVCDLRLNYIFDLVNILDYENISHFTQRCSHQWNQPDEKRNIWIPIKSALIDMRLDTLQVRVLWAWKEIWKKTYLDANAVRDVQEKLSLRLYWKRYFKSDIIIITIKGCGISVVKRETLITHLLCY